MSSRRSLELPLILWRTFRPFRWTGYSRPSSQAPSNSATPAALAGASVARGRMRRTSTLRPIRPRRASSSCQVGVRCARCPFLSSTESTSQSSRWTRLPREQRLSWRSSSAGTVRRAPSGRSRHMRRTCLRRSASPPGFQRAVMRWCAAWFGRSRACRVLWARQRRSFAVASRSSPKSMRASTGPTLSTSGRAGMHPRRSNGCRTTCPRISLLELARISSLSGSRK
mmetsp:Transcript_117771/g.263099  ORF Transcript_117771/g.263099 Transcript_117771/m.263099 type:complete len:226 (+) Transcript_117771:862-1539(+)